MADNLKLIFMGTAAFAVPSLLQLIDSNHDVSLVVSQPDRRRGRGRELSITQVKETALKNNIPVFQPENVNSDKSYSKLKEAAPDAIIVVSYGQLLRKRILDIPRLGCINIHASLLPLLRGAAPINWAIVNGLKRTGVTSMQMDIGMDTGDILLMDEVEIDDEINASELFTELSEMGGELLIRTLEAITKGTVTRTKQEHERATYAPVLTKANGAISFMDKDAKEIHNMVRGFSPWPGAYTSFKGRSVKILKTAYSLDEESEGSAPGTVIMVSKESLFVKAKRGVLEILRLQPQNKRPMPAADFINGYGIKAGDRFGGGK
jgi:methionyl-tRNA formyltransferase